MALPPEVVLAFGRWSNPTESHHFPFPLPSTQVSLFFSHILSFTVCYYRILEFEGKNRVNLELHFPDRDIDLLKDLFKIIQEIGNN